MWLSLRTHLSEQMAPRDLRKYFYYDTITRRNTNQGERGTFSPLGKTDSAKHQPSISISLDLFPVMIAVSFFILCLNVFTLFHCLIQSGKPFWTRGLKRGIRCKTILRVDVFNMTKMFQFITKFYLQKYTKLLLFFMREDREI